MMIRLGDMLFATLRAAKQHVQNILWKYQPGQIVDDKDSAIISAVLSRHPKSGDKIGCGVTGFEVRLRKFGARCFNVVRSDGTTEDFSYKKCLRKD